MTEHDDALSLDMVTAALRADSTDVAIYARVLVQSLGGQRAAAAHHLVQRGPGHEPRDDIRILAGHVGVEDLSHVRAAHPAHGLDLTGQPPPRVGSLGAERMEHLDRHRAALRIAGEVDYPHAAFPKAVLKAIRAEAPRQVFRGRHRGFQSTK